MSGADFTYTDFLRAANDYHDKSDWTERDIKGEEVYRRLVLERKKRKPRGLIEDAIKFLGHWNALRISGGGERMREFLPLWTKNNSALLASLGTKKLETLKPSDFKKVLYLAGSLWDDNIPPTTYGKTLHFFLPESVLLWDLAYVRNRYNLGGDPYTFTSYQVYGWRLLGYLVKNHGKAVLERMRREHTKTVGYAEPLTKMMDELAYHENLRKKAVGALDDDEGAFCLYRLLK